LLRWTGSSVSASIGAAYYALSGLFAARFNAGHVTFAFFHLLPVVMLAFEVLFAERLAGRAAIGKALLAMLAAFAFATSALPHGLIHFYPAFGLLFAVRIASAVRAHGLSHSLRAALVAITANAIGLWLAAYKLWPVVRWQIDSPREDVRIESYDLLQVLASSLTFVPDYLHIGRREAWHVFSSWEYNAFVGPAPWLLAVVALLAWRRTRSEARVAVAYGLMLTLAGVGLCLGNGNTWSPAAWFSAWPLLDGIRAFSRFQVLIVFGLAVLGCHGVAACERTLTGRARVLARGAIAVVVLGPLAAQAGTLIWNLHAQPNIDILGRYRAADPAGPPLPVRTIGQRLRFPRHETALIGAGFWIATCNSRLNLPGPAPRIAKGRAPLSHPPPSALEHLSRSSLALRYPASGPVTLNLRRPEGTILDVPEQRVRGRSVFDADQLEDRVLEISIVDPGPRQGALASAVGLGAAVLFMLALRRGGRA
jgi:hypothetical protein